MLKTNKRGGNTIIKIIQHIVPITFGNIFLNWNPSKGQNKTILWVPNCWGSAKIALGKMWKLEKNSKKFIKEKAFKISHTILNLNIFQTLQTPKIEVVRYINLLLQASTYNILASIGQRKQMPHLVIIWKFQKFQKLKNSNKLLLETFSNWSNTLPSASLC